MASIPSLNQKKLNFKFKTQTFMELKWSSVKEKGNGYKLLLLFLGGSSSSFFLGSLCTTAFVNTCSIYLHIPLLILLQRSFVLNPIITCGLNAATKIRQLRTLV